MFAIAKTYDLRLVKVWQRILGLNDRRIRSFVVSGDEIHRLAECEPSEDAPSGFVMNYHSHDISRIWFNRDTVDTNSSEHIILHEVTHIATDDAYRFCRNLINDFIADGATKQHLLDELEGENELQTNRLTRAFLRLKTMKAKEAPPCSTPL